MYKTGKQNKGEVDENKTDLGKKHNREESIERRYEIGFPDSGFGFPTIPPTSELALRQTTDTDPACLFVLSMFSCYHLLRLGTVTQLSAAAEGIYGELLQKVKGNLSPGIKMQSPPDPPVEPQILTFSFKSRSWSWSQGRKSRRRKLCARSAEMNRMPIENDGSSHSLWASDSSQKSFLLYLTHKTTVMENTVPLVSFENVTHSEYTDDKNNMQSNHTSNIYVDIGFPAVYSVLCLLGIIGNGLVIWFGIFKIKKTVNVVWFLSLAVADFSFLFFVPLNITQIVLKYWPFERFMCKLIHLFLGLNMGVSVLQITVIGIDRCICVVFPVWCQNHRRPKLAYIIVLTIWMISFALGIPFITYTDTNDIYDWTICAFKIDESSLIRRTVLVFVVFFVLPLGIILSCYIVIILHSKRKRIFTSSRPLKTIAAVIISFFICWFPSHVFSLLLTFENSRFDFFALYYGFLITNVLIILNSCINPVLYVFIGRDFKEQICGSLQAIFEKAFIEEDKAASERQERSATLQSLH
ncbi:formyl peptide receptor-related sequence 4-like [Dendropsophus ebraccatus]|uniref:formyl peptide receptor-related sequence 4-like n=1 Tax=Dendropsophus ebraccatus TaxID=150705 RepID=UPI0038320A85